ncbi:MAG: phage holin family protein [Desulfamplus sp.]|nr:phage holin family protein [Desulfamplus sp.]MBF0411112.1 phage holin family protein [Desulfamplus sp.]
MIWNIILLSASVFIVANVLPGIYIKNYWTAIVVAVVYSIISFFTGWLLILLTLPFMLITFGLFKFVINAFLLFLTDKMVGDFNIKDGFTTLMAAFCISIVDYLLRLIFF